MAIQLDKQKTVSRGGRTDIFLASVLLLLCAIGILNLYSATSGTPHHGKFSQQMLWLFLGGVVFVITMVTDYHFWFRWGWELWVIVVLAILAVHLLDTDIVKGSQRWIALGPVRVQPSEAAKPLAVLLCARLFADDLVKGLSLTEILLRVAGILVLLLAIVLQPDLGTATMVASIFLTCLFVFVRSLWPLVAAVGAGLLGIAAMWGYSKTFAYQKNRMLTFLSPEDASGLAWQTNQSIYAVGSGQVTGKGFMEATQNEFGMLPEYWTDFPFAVLAEEWGFLGAIFVLLLYALLLFWVVTLSMEARDRVGQVLCVGVAAMLFWHMCVNLLMVIGLGPVVGVTLPFLSYGGSSLLTFAFAFGLVASVSRRRLGH